MDDHLLAGVHAAGRIQRSWVRTVYLYLLSLLGLLLLTIGAVRFLDMGLKAWVFREAEREERYLWHQPPAPPGLERLQLRGDAGGGELSAEERAALRRWMGEYRDWKERAGRVDPIRARRERTAASSLALILIGLPLYLYHWRLIRREDQR